MPGAGGVHKRMSGVRVSELKLLTAVNHYVGAQK